jgi:hypothetical protein
VSRHLLTRARSMGIALLLAATGLGLPATVQPALGYSCTVTPVMVRYPGVVTAKIKWGPDCNPNYAYPLSVWQQTGPSDWTKLWEQYYPNQVATTGGNYYDMLHGYYCNGIGYFKARGYIGGVTAWSPAVYCLPSH